MYQYSENHPLILDNEFINSTHYFYSTDSNDIYKKNLLKYGNTWEYYDTTIEYEYERINVV